MARKPWCHYLISKRKDGVVLNYWRFLYPGWWAFPLAMMWCSDHVEWSLIPFCSVLLIASFTGHRGWCLCSPFNTTIFAWYQGCCGKSCNLPASTRKLFFLSKLWLVSQVGGVHFSLLSKVRHDIGDSCSLDYLIDSIFPLFRKHIEPDLHHAQVNFFGCFQCNNLCGDAILYSFSSCFFCCWGLLQIRINNSFVSSFREPYYKLKCKSEVSTSSTNVLGNSKLSIPFLIFL